MNLDIFRAYDIRGVFGADFEPNDFYSHCVCIHRVFSTENVVAVGHDVRESSPELWRQVANGLRDSGVEVLNLGQISTDMLYFSVAHYKTDGGIVITASHNPAAYNGMKLVGEHAAPISEDTGLFAVRDAVGRATAFEKQNGDCRGNLPLDAVSGCLLIAPSLVCRFVLGLPESGLLSTPIVDLRADCWVFISGYTDSGVSAVVCRTRWKFRRDSWG